MNFEQEYYDALYTIRKLKEKNRMLEQETQIYKSLLKKDNLKWIIGKDLVRFLQDKNLKSEKQEGDIDE